ncbi:GIP [Symbiodinium sp. CCMP2592]|nr:GIP [Symbiodinium sp. CCMP2592]
MEGRGRPSYFNIGDVPGKGAAKDHANALTFGDKGKGKKGDKGKEEKGKGKDKGKDNKKGNEKGKEEKGKGGKDKGKDKGKTAAAKDGKQGSGNDKDKEKEKAERLKNVKCYNCDQFGHYSNKCPKPKRERASAAALLEPQVAAASLEPQIFAAAVDLSCPVVELDEDDCSDFSQEDWEEFVASYECAWSEPVVLEGGEPVALEGSMLHVALENFPCDNPNRATVELAESRGVPNRTTVELAESHQVPDRTTVELAESTELSLEAGRFVADFQNVVEHDMLHVVGRSDHGMVAHETAAASQQHDTMDWWLVDSGASAHIINEDTLSRVHVVSHSESASECVSATGDSIGVRRSAVVRVPFVLVSGETVVTELQVLVAPVKFNLLSLGRLLGKSWVVDFLPSFKVEAAGYVLRTRWVSNCGWVFSSAVELDLSVAVAARASLKRSDGCESSSDSEQEWRLSGRRHLAEQHAATVTRTHEDFEGSTIAFTATSMVGLTPGQNLLLVPAAEVKKKTAEQAKAAAKAAAEKFVKERQESAQWAKEAEEAKKKRAAKAEAKKKAATEAEEAEKKAATEAAETEKKAATEATEAEKKAATEAVEAEKKAATEAKKRVAEAIGVPEVKKPKGSVARAKAEPSSGSKDPPQPLVKRQPKPPVVKAMPAKVRKIVLKSRAQRGIPGQTETALRMLSQRAKEKKKQGYLMKAINNAMKKKAEEHKGPPVRRTLERHVKDHFAQIKGLEVPFVEVTVSEVIKEPPGPPGSPMVPQPRTPPARAKVEAARAVKVPQLKVEGGMEINPPPPVPPRRRLPTPPRDPRSAGRGASAPSEWSPVSSLPPWSPVSSVPVDTRARETPAERRAEELHIGDDGKIYNSRGEVVELESIEIDAHHPGISDGPSSLGLSLLMQEKVAFACEHDVAVELGEHACVGGLGEHDLQHGELLEHVGQDRPQRDRSEAHDSQSEAWLLRGDRELLLQESWGKLEREHVLRSHVPYNASCPQCVQGRGLEPARSQDRPQDSGMREVQIDKFFYKGLAFLVLVLVGAFALGVVPYREVSGSRGPAAKEAMLSDMSAWSRSVGLVGVAPSELTVSVKSDIEGVVKNLAQSFADGLTAGAIEVVDAPVGRHAVVAERAVRTIKEGANTLCAGLEQVGLEPCGKGVTYLLMHVAQVYNRSPSLRDKITGRYGHAAYLGPEVGSGSHIVQFRLRDGTLKIARSARIRMLVPLTFEVSSLKGVCRMLPGREDDSQKKLPESSGDNVRDLPLPNTATRGPPPEWIEENGRTPRCRACRLRGFPADKAWHTQKCRDRYAEFVRNSFDPSRAILDQAPIEEEVTGRDDLGAGFGVDLGLEVPDDLDPFPNFPLDEDLAEYEPSLPGVENEVELGEELEQIEAPSPGELDFMQVDPEPLEALPEEEREAMVSTMMYRESISFAGASVCFAGAATKVDLNWVNVLTVSERDDGASAQTLLELKAIFAEQIKKKGFVFLWASTPCTGGCPYQRLRARDPAYRRGRLAQHWRLHRKLWRSLVELTSFVHAWAIEWPRACAYWSWRQTEHFLSSRPYVLHDVPVDGCALDMRGRDHLLIAKRWRVVTTHPAVAESIRVYRCSGKHEHSKDFDLKNTQHYPVELVKSFFEALRS